MLTSSIQQINTLFYILLNKAYIILSYLCSISFVPSLCSCMIFYWALIHRYTSHHHGCKSDGYVTPVIVQLLINLHCMCMCVLCVGACVCVYVCAVQWRSEGNLRQGANLNFAPPPSKMTLKCLVFN